MGQVLDYGASGNNPPGCVGSPTVDSSEPGSLRTLDTDVESRKAMLALSPLFKRGPLGCAALLTLISLRVLLPTRGDVRTVSPVENGRYVGSTKRQDVAVRVLR